jgi:hypothetical protein
MQEYFKYGGPWGPSNLEQESKARAVWQGPCPLIVQFIISALQVGKWRLSDLPQAR